MPKEKREEVRNEISRAHFQIGTGECIQSHSTLTLIIEFPSKSWSHDHYGNLDVANKLVEEN